jgi:deoxyribodipyrimidine photo-lyase
MATALWWVRRDMRLADNRALTAALSLAGRVIPVFVLDPLLLAAPDAGPQRVAFLLGGLRALDGALRDRGSRLIVRRGDPPHELARLRSETGAEAIFAEEDYWPYARSRDAQVGRTLPLHLVGGLTLYPPEATLKADGTPYTVFTPFSRKWRSLPPPQAGEVLPTPGQISTPAEVDSLPIPEEPAFSPAVPFPPGEAEAQRRLSAFVDGEEKAIYRYGEGRDRLDLDETSHLSPYLRFGMLSTRQVVITARRAIEAAPDAQARTGAQTWLNELIWREFYQTILYHFPHVLEQSFRPDLQSIAWENDTAAFAAWRAGRTGYPVVDAGMRQLARTGWMHNRARMIVASFLVKDLLVDWRWGERHFMLHLVDGDAAANNGGWQWAAGTGTDAAPYFRVFNPVLQSHKYDPNGDYVRRWVPELTGVPDRFIHAPWKMPPDGQRAAGCLIGRDYPAPIVEHAWARERALAAYRTRKPGFSQKPGFLSPPTGENP